MGCYLTVAAGSIFIIFERGTDIIRPARSDEIQKSFPFPAKPDMRKFFPADEGIM